MASIDLCHLCHRHPLRCAIHWPRLIEKTQIYHHSSDMAVRSLEVVQIYANIVFSKNGVNILSMMGILVGTIMINLGILSCLTFI